jgi:hypothetical protein
VTNPIYIPLMPRTKRPIKAATRWSDLSVDEAVIGRWWDAAPEDANTALRLDGLLVIDCDSEEAAWWWMSQPGWETDTIVATPHGLHFYYVLPEGVEAPPAGAMKHPDGRPRGVDVKTGAGHYVLVPPSKNEEGVAYRWM